MPATTANAAALVPGAAAPAEPSRSGDGQRVRLLRAICISGERVEAGSEITVSLSLAREMRSAQKAEFLDAPASPASPDTAPESSAAPARGRARKEATK